MQEASPCLLRFGWIEYNRMRSIAPLISFLLLCAGLSGSAPSFSAQTFGELDRPVPMPSFRIPSLDGKGGSDADLRNKVTIIRFWATW